LTALSQPVLDKDRFQRSLQSEPRLQPTCVTVLWAFEDGHSGIAAARHARRICHAAGFQFCSANSISSDAFGFCSFTATQCLFASSQELPVMQTGLLGEHDFPANMDFKLRVHTQAPFSQPQFSGQLTQR
jgi:hypothetical protein